MNTLHIWVALNTYGSMVELGNNAPCDGILQDSNGCFLVVFALRMKHVSILEAELWEIFYGLKWTWERGFHKIKIYSDSLIAIELLKDGCLSLYSSSAYSCGENSPGSSTFE
ncbi:heat shock 70 kDa protein [Trifolium repens]|nr:heat shock 70 kDa protein [Trifolium repens]